MRKCLLIILFIGFLVQILVFASVDISKDKDIKELSNPVFLEEIVRHLYRWYLDEADIEKYLDSPKFIFQVRLLSPKLDEGDRSQYAEIYIPFWKISVKVKKSDYIIEEIGKEIKSNGFKIVNVSRISNEALSSSEFTTVEFDIDEMREYLKTTRSKTEFPDEELLEKMKIAFEKQLASLRNHELIDVKHDDEIQDIISIAPLSPVGNDIWVFWESGKMIIHCTSDIDISNREAWAHGEFIFHCYDAYNDTVLSLAEAKGSNELFTRNQVGRILYNCIVLGKCISLTNQTNENKFVK